MAKRDFNRFQFEIRFDGYPINTSLTVYHKKYAHVFCFAVLCCGYTLTDFPISIRLTSLALWQSNDCPSADKATLMNMDKYFMWIHYERLHNHNKAKHNKPVCIFIGIYCTWQKPLQSLAMETHMVIPAAQLDHLIVTMAVHGHSGRHVGIQETNFAAVNISPTHTHIHQHTHTHLFIVKGICVMWVK